MAVFRVEKTKDFTVMCNHHLRNVKLSLKAKGLLSLMLSLPEDWDYTTKGLACICRDGVDSIASCRATLSGRLKRHFIIANFSRKKAQPHLNDTVMPLSLHSLSSMPGY